MVKELNEIIKSIEVYFTNCIWTSRPPIKEVDFQLVVLSQKLIELRDNLVNTKDIDKSISDVMTFMESTFHIPLLDYTEWLKVNYVRHRLVLNIYTKLSNLRSI